MRIGVEVRIVRAPQIRCHGCFPVLISLCSHLAWTPSFLRPPACSGTGVKKGVGGLCAVVFSGGGGVCCGYFPRKACAPPAVNISLGWFRGGCGLSFSCLSFPLTPAGFVSRWFLKRVRGVGGFGILIQRAPIRDKLCGLSMVSTWARHVLCFGVPCGVPCASTVWSCRTCLHVFCVVYMGCVCSTQFAHSNVREELHGNAVRGQAPHGVSKAALEIVSWKGWVIRRRCSVDCFLMGAVCVFSFFGARCCSRVCFGIAVGSKGTLGLVVEASVSGRVCLRPETRMGSS